MYGIIWVSIMGILNINIYQPNSLFVGKHTMFWVLTMAIWIQWHSLFKSPELHTVGKPLSMNWSKYVASKAGKNMIFFCTKKCRSRNVGELWSNPSKRVTGYNGLQENGSNVFQLLILVPCSGLRSTQENRENVVFDHVWSRISRDVQMV